jgi:hypothetical protein
MSVQLTDDELRMELDFHRKPLEQIKDSHGEWHLGGWSLAKGHRTWRHGHGRQLVPGAVVRTLPFDLDAKQGVGLLFESNIVEPKWYFIGWVPTPRAQEAARWVEFLNSEIANRLADRPAGENWTYDPHDGKAAQDYEDELARDRFQKSLGVKPYKPKDKT